MFISQDPGGMVSSTMAPTAEGNLATSTVEFVSAKEIVVCAVKTGARSSDPIVGTVVEVALSINKVRPPDPLCPAGPVGPINRVFPDQFGAKGPLIVIG
jgi:hypothetical protein